MVQLNYAYFIFYLILIFLDYHTTNFLPLSFGNISLVSSGCYFVGQKAHNPLLLKAIDNSIMNIEEQDWDALYTFWQFKVICFNKGKLYISHLLKPKYSNNNRKNYNTI